MPGPGPGSEALAPIPSARRPSQARGDEEDRCRQQGRQLLGVQDLAVAAERQGEAARARVRRLAGDERPAAVA